LEETMTININKTKKGNKIQVQLNPKYQKIPARKKLSKIKM